LWPLERPGYAAAMPRQSLAFRGSATFLTAALTAVLAVAGALAACSQPGPTTIATTFDPCEALVVVPAASSTAEQVASVGAALKMWNDVANTRLTLDAAQNPQAPHVPITFQAAPGAFYGLYEDKLGDILVNANVTDDWARTVCVAHELGHSFGLVHVYGHDSVMNSPNLSIQPNASDAGDLAKLWGACPAPER
jgi:hypothetical protein